MVASWSEEIEREDESARGFGGSEAAGAHNRWGHADYPTICKSPSMAEIAKAFSARLHSAGNIEDIEMLFSKYALFGCTKNLVHGSTETA